MNKSITKKDLFKLLFTWAVKQSCKDNNAILYPSTRNTLYRAYLLFGFEKLRSFLESQYGGVFTYNKWDVNRLRQNKVKGYTGLLRDIQLSN